MSLFIMTPSEARASIIECFEAGLVPSLESSPGVGKSSLIHQIAADFQLYVIDLRLSMCAPEDLMGLPSREGKKSVFSPFAMFPIRGDAIPKGYKGWILFLDEFTSATKAVQAAAYKVVLDRMVGQEYLHESVFIACAGNKMTDGAIVTEMGTAMQSRLVHIQINPSFPEFIKYANQQLFDYRVIGYLESQPSKLHEFDPDHNDKTFACPRTWEFASKLIKGKSFEQVNLPLLAGTISEGAAVAFHAFLKEYEYLPKIEEIIADPQTAPVPDRTSTQYATASMLLEYCTKTNFGKLATYMKRFSADFQVVFFRGVVARDKTMERNPEYVSSIQHLTRFLNDNNAALAA